ncbi:complex I NDUFA9 subunit family protein [Sphingomonas lenta]|uniref:Complex I NDUFA9 subunit family protein n=1 Tax=Sphingomonas lenta TaxID=1141887 RepID=A0A2A2SFG8_9SPHN|nr:complex I NDUFA9 subunit family protein [Sphingomonas lenta]PAX07989.1 complex I NDUFA9 subunit family protein [Sphingomonas lenta]
MVRGKLVTLIGGGGFLGRYAAQALLRDGARLRVAQRDPRQAWYIKSLGQLGGTQTVAADITRPDTLQRAVRGSDAVVNLVGILAGDFQRVHVDGARAVAEACAAEGVSGLVHVSAIGADPESPSAYGRSKGEGEAAVRAAFPNATILRPSIVFGREDQFLNRFAGLIARLPIVPILSPATRFQPVFVGDVADAVSGALKDLRAHAGRTYELGGPDILSMAELNRYIAQEIGRDPAFVEVPDSIGATIAKLGFLPGAPITSDQWMMLRRDNVVSADAAGLEAFGVTPTPLAAVAPSYLVQYRRAGRFGRRKTGWAS